jgi:hypothetical protein
MVNGSQRSGTISEKFKVSDMTMDRTFTNGSGRWSMAFLATVITLLLLVLNGPLWAFEEYDGCENCHGEFTEGTYTSRVDGTSWGTDLMTGHEAFVGSNCNACHKSGGFGEVFLNFSDDSTLSKSCVGCHGRDEDVNGSCTGIGDDGMPVECGSGAGLRLHHESEVGSGTCSGCHSGDPAPVGEHILPFNYGKSGVVMMDSCDSDGSESQHGDRGLDNDGDGQADADDSDCQQSENNPPSQPGMLSASAVTASSATVMWGASTDDDGDPITYQVDYRRSSDMSWSDGGSTSSTSQALSGLDSGQSYDVRVTPNDGTDDGPSRLASDLFETLSGGGTFVLNAGLNGNWWNGLDRNGEGFQMEFSDGGDGTLVLVATMYSYDTMGNQIFLLAIASGIKDTDSVEVTVYIYEGGMWGDDFDPSLVTETEWGTGVISASNCESMSVKLMPNATFQSLGYTDLMYDLIRLTTPVVPCPI